MDHFQNFRVSRHFCSRIASECLAAPSLNITLRFAQSKSLAGAKRSRQLGWPQCCPPCGPTSCLRSHDNVFDLTDSDHGSLGATFPTPQGLPRRGQQHWQITLASHEVTVTQSLIASINGYQQWLALQQIMNSKPSLLTSINH